LVTKSCTLDRVDVRADDDNGVSDAGLLIAATLGQRLGLPELLREPGRRVILRLPRRWPWAGQILAALDRLRALPAASG